MINSPVPESPSNDLSGLCVKDLRDTFSDIFGDKLGLCVDVQACINAHQEAQPAFLPRRPPPEGVRGRGGAGGIEGAEGGIDGGVGDATERRAKAVYGSLDGAGGMTTWETVMERLWTEIDSPVDREEALQKFRSARLSVDADPLVLAVELTRLLRRALSSLDEESEAQLLTSQFIASVSATVCQQLKLVNAAQPMDVSELTKVTRQLMTRAIAPVGCGKQSAATGSPNVESGNTTIPRPSIYSDLMGTSFSTSIAASSLKSSLTEPLDHSLNTLPNPSTLPFIRKHISFTKLTCNSFSRINPTGNKLKVLRYHRLISTNRHL
ncbi:unnamed protein product [Schistosoma curassoni]|uniref:Uncharacterized protein n=1 Tax=Schistosoma curassoni TaxID=6186 RepID=A0A183KUM9_9TREM|nr:unnamed protein product [Schistosoma curassoni]